jgi:hypothetical protein
LKPFAANATSLAEAVVPEVTIRLALRLLAAIHPLNDVFVTDLTSAELPFSCRTETSAPNSRVPLLPAKKPVDDLRSAFLTDTQAELPLFICAKRVTDTIRVKTNKINNFFMRYLSLFFR